MTIDNPRVIATPIVSATGTLTSSGQIEDDDSANKFVTADEKTAVTAIEALDTSLNKDKVLRLTGESSFAAGFPPIVEAQINAVETTREEETGTSIDEDPIWYIEGTPTQTILNSFEVNPGPSSSWARAEVADGIPPILGSTTTYTLVSRDNLLFTGVASGTGPSGTTLTEVTNLTLSGYHVYTLVVPSGDPTNPADFPEPSGSRIMVSATGLEDSVKISEENISNLDIRGHTQLDSLLSTLFGGASVSIDHGTTRVEVADGFAYGVDYRDNAATGTPDIDHYIGPNVTVGTQSIAAVIGFSGRPAVDNTLIGIQVSLHTERVGEGALVVVYEAGGVEHDLMHINTERNIEVDVAPAGVERFVNLETAVGDVVLDANSTHWIILEIRRTDEPQATIVPVVVSTASDGTVTTFECNDVDIDLTDISSTLLGISRSQNQIGQVDQWKVIANRDYINHANLARLARDHETDRYCWGYARRLAEADRKKVTLDDGVEIEGRVINTDEPKPELVVHQSTTTSTTGEGSLVSLVQLPVNYGDYNYISITEYDNASLQWRHAQVSTYPFVNSLIGTNDSIRLQGNTAMSWLPGTRTISMVGNVVEIFRVALRD